MIAWYSELFRTPPVLTQAGEYGWISHRRLWWIRGSTRPLCNPSKFKLPPDLRLAWPSPDKAHIRDSAKRPIPASVTYSDRYSLAVNPRDILKQGDDGARVRQRRGMWQSGSVVVW